MMSVYRTYISKDGQKAPCEAGCKSEDSGMNGRGIAEESVIKLNISDFYMNER